MPNVSWTWEGGQWGRAGWGLLVLRPPQKAALSQLLSGDLMLLKHLVSSAPGKPPSPLSPGEAPARWSGTVPTPLGVPSLSPLDTDLWSLVSLHTQHSLLLG